MIISISRERLDKHAKWLRDEAGGERLVVMPSEDLSGADLRSANLRSADFRSADLRSADLSGADLSGADLRSADLSSALGLPDCIDYLSANFEFNDDGMIAYKTFGGNYAAPRRWAIEPGSVLNEVVNPLPTTNCGCGINVATRKWVKANASGAMWRVLIRWMWLPSVVVPFDTDGKIRCGRVELIEVVE